MSFLLDHLTELEGILFLDACKSKLLLSFFLFFFFFFVNFFQNVSLSPLMCF